MTTTTTRDAISKGVEGSFDFWLSQHDVSTPEIIECAVKSAFTDWLDAHTDALVAAIVSNGTTSPRPKATEPTQKKPTPTLDGLLGAEPARSYEDEPF
jgi:hypothetical protein